MKNTGKIKSVFWTILAGGFTILMAHGATPPSLSNYPKSSRIWLGIEEGLVRPKGYSQGRAQVSSNVSLNAHDGQALKKGDLWAVLDPQELELERRSLEVDEYKFSEKLRENKKSLREKAAKTQLDLNTIEQQKTRLQLALEAAETPRELKTRIREALQQADEEISLLENSLTPEQQEKKLQMDEEEGRVLLEKKRKDFEELKKRSELTAESDGVLQLSNAAKEQLNGKADGLIWMNANQLVGSVTDDRSFEIVVSAKSSLITQLRKEDLQVVMEEGQTGKLISAEFEKVDELDSGSDLQQNYLFQISASSMEGARQSVGQRSLVHVYRKLPEPCHVIMKRDIAFLDPATLESAGWEGLVMKLWPGSQVVQVASQTIAIKVPDGN